MPVKQKPFNSDLFSFSDFFSNKTNKSNKTKINKSKTIKSKTMKSKTIKSKTHSSLRKTYSYDENTISNILNTIYSMNNPINNTLIKYNDNESKLLNKESFNNFNCFLNSDSDDVKERADTAFCKVSNSVCVTRPIPLSSARLGRTLPFIT